MLEPCRFCRTNGVEVIFFSLDGMLIQPPRSHVPFLLSSPLSERGEERRDPGKEIFHPANFSYCLKNNIENKGQIFFLFLRILRDQYYVVKKHHK